MNTKNSTCCILFIFYAVFIEIVQPTCVLESEFGFKINCAFKKSGLFRVRNLGGIKAHASLGFSLGDELGFEQSLTNLDPSRRRSVSVKNGAPNLIADTSARPAVKQEKRGKQNRIMMRPAAPAGQPNQAAMDKLTTLHRQGSSTMKPIVVSGLTTETVPANPARARVHPTITMAKPMHMGVPPFKPLPPKEDNLKVLPIAQSTKKSYTPLQIPQSKGPGPMSQSENYYPQISHDQVSKMVSQMTATHNHAQPLLRITPTPFIINTPKIYSIPTTINPFVPMPIAAPPSQGLTIIPAPILKDSMQTLPMKSSTYAQNSYSIQNINPISNFVDPVPHQVHDLASLYPVYNTKKVDDYNSISGYGDDTTLKFNKEDINAKIAEIAKAGNISMEAVEAAIALRQQQLLSKYANIQIPASSSTTSTTTTTTEETLIFQPEPEPEILSTVPQKPKRMPTSGKVMNAPREYYPVGYEKNFDDHFQSKVDLPETNFHCGDQKYFPGLYGDESLGCMVFHVCALTDDGLVMKSFLCPESTLFDQTILKCNWWFYVDCKNTVRLYDTNIPVSKSYQLMKALTFFSSYKKEMQNDGHPTNPEDVEGIKEAITILENQDSSMRVPEGSANNAVEIVTPQPSVDERRYRITANNNSSPVYRSTRNYNASHLRRNTEEFKLVTVNAGINIDKENKSSIKINKENKSIDSADNYKTSSESSNERKYRRRLMLRNNNITTTASPIISQSTAKHIDNAASSSSSAVEIIKQEIQHLKSTPLRQEQLTDLDDADISETLSQAPVRRFYRSSAEKESNTEEKEMARVKNETVQIVRPTPIARLVGEFQTPAATIKKLDEAILGQSYSREKKDTVPVAMGNQSSENKSLSQNRSRT